MAKWILPDFIRRLRRARVGFFILMVGSDAVCSFTSAYIVRKGMPSLNQNTNQMVRTGLNQSAIQLLLVNTLVLLGSSVTMEFAGGKLRSK